jgi:hypothetical protein
MSPDPITVLFAVYATGVAIGLVFTDAGPLGRIGIALLWPLAFIAFAVTVAVLILAALVALPFRGRRPGTARP